MTTNPPTKNIKYINGRHYWIQRNGEKPEIAMYHTAVNGVGFFWKMEMKAVMTCASIDESFVVLKEAEFEN